MTNTAQAYDTVQDLLQPVFSKGQLVYTQPSIQQIQAHAKQQVQQFLQSDHTDKYPVGLEKALHELKQRLIVEVSSNLL